MNLKAATRKPATAEVTEQPPDPLALLADIHARVIRMETRQARHMLANGFDTEGQPLPARTIPRR